MYSKYPQKNGTDISKNFNRKHTHNMSNFYQDRTDIIHLKEMVVIPLSRSLT